MYMRLFRRVRIAPGISLNLAKHGPSVSFGVRGAHLTVGRSGIRRTVGIPGTGIFATSQDGWHSGLHTGRHFQEAAPPLTGARKVAHDLLVTVLLVIACLVVLGVILAAFGQ